MNTENIIDKLPKPEQFMNNLDTLKQKIGPILEDFKKYYVFYNKNPEYPEYQSMFETVKSQMIQVCSDLFVLENNVLINTDQINKELI